MFMVVYTRLDTESERIYPDASHRVGDGDIRQTDTATKSKIGYLLDIITYFHSG